MSANTIKNPTSVRDLSRTEVFQVIRRERLISRSELAKSVSVSRATVSGIVADLLRIGLLEEEGEGESTGGRRPIKLRYRPENRKAVGVVLFNNQIQAAITDMEGSLLNYLEIPLEENTPQAMLTAMKTAAEQILHDVPLKEVLGIGVGAPGIVDFESGVIEISVSKGWLEGGIPVKAFLEKNLGLPVYVANRSRVAALGEQRAIVDHDVRNLVYLFLGEGIAAGIVIDGRLYLGSGSGAGEIGHVSIAPDGPLCDCGNRGCLEVYASENGFLARARELARENTTSRLQTIVDGHLERLTIDHIIEAAHQGDPAAVLVFNEIGARIGFSVSTLINLFNPEMVVIGGPIGSRTGDLLLQPVIKEAQLRTIPRSFRGTHIVTGTLGTRAIAVGAAVLAILQTPVHLIFEPPLIESQENKTPPDSGQR